MKNCTTQSKGYSAKLTFKYQATIPKEIREALNLKIGDKIVYELRVMMRKSSLFDIEYVRTLSSTLNEWVSDKDEQAYKNL